jgi:L-gulonate 5-dehydrogenase
MRALRTVAAERMELEDVSRPGDPGPGEALLRIEAVGICGSDYALFRGTHPLSQFPAVQGHEFCATVTGLGPGEGPGAVGERVVVEPLLPCGHCYPCSVGRTNCCINLEILGVHRPGALQEELVVARRLLHPAGELPAEVAAFAEPMSIGLQAVNRGAIEAADSVLVLGAGPIGLAATMAARARGARVAVSDPVAERREYASGCGADLVLDGGAGVADAARAWSGGGEGPTVVLDAVGAPATVRTAIELVAAAGRVVVVGISTAEAAIPIAPLTRKEMTILGSRNSVGIFADAVALVAANRERIEPLITQRIGLGEVEATIGLALSHPERVVKAVVTP